MRKKMTNVERAKQFLPFNSLRGFYALVKNKEKIITKKKELSTDELERLSYLFNQLQIGDIVTIKYYETDGYVSFTGMISNIDWIYKTITLVTTVIKISDIIEINSSILKEL